MPKTKITSRSSTASICQPEVLSNNELISSGHESANLESEYRAYGLRLCGVVVERTKRMIPKDNPTTEVVTYTVMDKDSSRRYFVDEFTPDDYYNVDEYISVPVYVKPYRKKNGDLSYILCVQKEYHSSMGQPF